MSFADELALDRAEAELATEMPAYVRALAKAYVDGKPPPRAPELPSVDLAVRALAGDLAPRGLRLLRELAPIVIEDDPTVAAIRSTAPSWPAYAALSSARAAASKRVFGCGHIAQLHWLHGTGAVDAPAAAWPAELAGWHEAEAPIPLADLERLWRDLADRHGATGSCRIVETTARPRTFVVEPGREVIVAIGSLTTPALRFAALHELGHALAGLLSPLPLPRMLDEAAAAYIARLLEVEGPWHTPLAEPARARRTWLVMGLVAIEGGAPPPAALPRPPWSLWHDPGAQAMYFVAERFAFHWWQLLGASPARGDFARRLALEVEHVERAVLRDRELAHAIHPAT